MGKGPEKTQDPTLGVWPHSAWPLLPNQGAEPHRPYGRGLSSMDQWKGRGAGTSLPRGRGVQWYRGQSALADLWPLPR